MEYTPLVLYLIIVVKKQFNRNIFDPIANQYLWLGAKIIIPYTVIATAVPDNSSIYVYYAISLILLWLSSRPANTCVSMIPFIYFRNNPEVIRSRAILLFLICSAILLISYGQGFDHYGDMSELSPQYNVLVNVAPTLFEYSLLVITASFLLKGSSNILWLAATMAVALWVGYEEGGRSRLILPLWLGLLAYSDCVKKITIYKFCIMLACFLLAIGPLLMQYKEYKMSQSTGITASDDQSLETSLYHFSSTEIHTKFIYDNVPTSIPYEFGEKIFDELKWVFVPRIFFHDKPTFENGKYFSYLIYGGESDLSKRKSSDGIGALGELYLNFGYYGLPIIYIFGRVLAISISRLKIYRVNEPYQVYLVRKYFIFSAVAMFLFFEISGYIATIIRMYIYTNIYLFLLTFRLKHYSLLSK